MLAHAMSQHDAHGAHQHPQRRLDVAGQPLLQRNQGHRLQAVLRILPREAVANGPHLRLRAREVHAGLELPDGVVVVQRCGSSPLVVRQGAQRSVAPG